MDERAYRLMAEVEQRHWWWCGRRAIVGMLLGRLRRDGELVPGVLVDLGCGVGSNLGVLERYGRALGYDTSEVGVSVARARGHGNVFIADLARGHAGLPRSGPGALEPSTASVVLLADVIEHLPDDQAALSLARQLLVPGGTLIVTVPAFQFLWGPTDELNHHYRRYSRAMLARAVAAQLEVQRLSYFNSFMFAPITAARLLERLLRSSGQEEVAVPPVLVNEALRRLFSSEARLLERVDLPFGVSLLCVARKAG